jgi:phenylalanyl-tRNA synthetase alpha chain
MSTPSIRSLARAHRVNTYLTADHLHRALSLRDLSDPQAGPHAMQVLLDHVLTALTDRWHSTLRVVRNPPLVSVRDNYDRLGYAPQDVTRESRNSRYTSPTTMLRSHTSADIPATLDTYDDADSDVDELIAISGLVYRRDVVDRTHVGEPHQVDLWRLRSAPDTTEDDLEQMVSTLVEAVMPGARWRTTPAVHPYTRHGRQVDVVYRGEWLELAECGLIHRDVLRRGGLDPSSWSGLALGMGLERALMLRKDLPDIRYLRSTEPGIRTQMADLDLWREVSTLPPISRDMSVVVDAQKADELLGDQVRTALPDRLDDIERIEVLARTSWDDLPAKVRNRLGIEAHQTNALIRLSLRPLDRTLTDAEANDLRNQVYLAIHEGPYQELA